MVQLCRHTTNLRPCPRYSGRIDLSRRKRRRGSPHHLVSRDRKRPNVVHHYGPHRERLQRTAFSAAFARRYRRHGGLGAWGFRAEFKKILRISLWPISMLESILNSYATRTNRSNGG